MAEWNPGQIQECEQKLPLPIGVSNYSLAASEYYYIGKTLNMDMLRTYFERSDKDTSVYFRDKKYGPAEKSIETTRADIR